MLQGLDRVRWEELPQPSGNGMGEVPAAIRALRDAVDGRQAQDAYNRVLYAVGNNHAGTYYPVVVHVIPFLGELLASGRPIVRETALDVLIDLMSSFEPEPAFETIEGELEGLVRRTIADLAPSVQRCADACQPGSRAAQLVGELLEAIRDEGT